MGKLFKTVYVYVHLGLDMVVYLLMVIGFFKKTR